MRSKSKSLLALFLLLFAINCAIQIKSTDPAQTVSDDDIYGIEDSEIYWDSRNEIIMVPPYHKQPEINEITTIFKNDLPANSFYYVYGGKTACKVQPGKSKSGFLSCYLDNEEYSGVTLCLGRGKNLDLSSYRDKGTAAIAFWAKGGPGVKNLFMGVLDDDSDGKKVQSKLILGDFGAIDTTWKYYMIPLRRFSDQGMFWDDNRLQEASSVIDWKNINEVRFSVNKGANHLPKDEPAAFYVNDMTIIESIPGYIDPEDYWNSFKSDEPDVILHDFEGGSDEKWTSSTGPESQVSFSVTKTAGETGQSKALSINYKLNDWCDVLFNYADNGFEKASRNWTKHWGIKFNMYTEKAYQPIFIQVGDAGGELFIASAGGNKGWTEVLVPLKKFMKFPYYQPPQAVQNGVFDLQGITSIDFKPSGEGTSGSFMIDNVCLTNERQARKKEVPKQVDLVVSGSLEKTITSKINPGIFGINSATWDADLILPKTADYVKDVNHYAIRYPGGLSSDEYDWKSALAKKDAQIDIDEFLDFCNRTKTTPMITVNFGTGSVQDAADWVQYCNIKKKANVKYWEVGNELYGSWHAKHCTAEEYGKRAREYILAMKAVDPSILVTVVGVLEGEWNKTVLELTGDVADGINVHHYPQNTGEENDAGLLASPQALNDIIPGLHKQLKEYGQAGKKYQIWLTEWNSVNFDPGPQSLSIVNALFAADYLGMLAVHNIEHASYWNIHNNIFPQGGDYGYLSIRMSDPKLDNLPRPSYWAFLLASKSLGRGSLHFSATGNEQVSSYLTSDDRKQSLMLINKYPETSADVKISIPGFSGKAVLSQLNKGNADAGPHQETITVQNGTKISLPPHSITVVNILK